MNSKPQINKKSDILAKKRRAEDQTLGVNIVEHLLAQPKHESIRQKIKQKNAEKEALEQEEFPYKPVTNNYNLPAAPTSGDKCFDLYSRVQQGKYAKNVGREVDEI